jgi:S-disulfanyl-L-cysteine oxidoreductase SoxD
MNRVVLAAIVAAGVAYGIGLSVEAQQPKSQWDAIYSPAQAERGKELYAANCALCHARNLSGTPAGPPLAGAAFTQKWNNRSLGELFDYMQLLMPVFNPGGLTRKQNAEILAYMLEFNEFPSGRADLSSDPQVVGQFRFLSTKNAAADVRPETRPIVKEDASLSGRYYTLDQAARGKLLFGRYCGTCHPVPMPLKSGPPPPVTLLPGAFGGRIALDQKVLGMQKDLYPSVYHFYEKLSTMPPWDTSTVSPQMKADIAAYVLQTHSYPSGTQELTPDLAAMKTMMLNEPGFKQVFNGRDFAGIKFVLGINCLPAPEGCGRSDPGSMIKIENQTLGCPTPCQLHGFWYIDEKYLNFTLRFDYRFDRPPGWDDSVDDDLYTGQSGYWLFNYDLHVYPVQNVTIDGRHYDILEPRGAGVKDTTVDVEARLRARKRLGEWNAVEIVSRGGDVKASLNGTLITTVRKHGFTKPGYILFQYQGAPLYFRNVRIKPE